MQLAMKTEFEPIPYTAPSLGWKSLLGASLCISSFSGVGTDDISDSKLDVDYEDWSYD